MINQLRLLQLLSGMNQPGNDLPSQGGITGQSTGPYNPDGPVGSDDIRTIASQIPGTQQLPSDSAEMQLRAMLGQMPIRNKPGIGRNIMAGLAGLGPGRNESADSVRYAPYYHDLADWKAKLAPLKELADTEKDRITNQRLIDSSERTAANNLRKIEEKADSDQAKQEAADKDREIKRQRANTEEYVAKNPKSVYKETAEGNIIAVDPVTNAIEMLRDAAGEPIKTINLTPEQKKAMEVTKQAGRIEAIREGAKQTRITNEVKAGITEKIEKMRQAGRIELRKTPSGNSSVAAGKTLQPSQQRIDRINNVMEIISAFPELEPYYDIDDDGNVKVSDEKADPNLRQIAYNKLFDSKKNDVPLNAKSPKTVKPTVREDGKTHVRRNGQDGWVTKPLSTDELIP